MSKSFCQCFYNMQMCSVSALPAVLCVCVCVCISCVQLLWIVTVMKPSVFSWSTHTHKHALRREWYAVDKKPIQTTNLQHSNSQPVTRSLMCAKDTVLECRQLCSTRTNIGKINPKNFCCSKRRMHAKDARAASNLSWQLSFNTLSCTCTEVHVYIILSS